MDRSTVLNNKKGAIPILVLLMLGLVITGIGLGLIGTGSLVGSGGYIERPVFKYVKCEAISSLKYSDFYLIDKGGIFANKPSVTDKYDLIIQYPNSKLALDRIEYSVCNQRIVTKENCRIYKRYEQIASFSSDKNILISNIKPEEYVRIQFQRNYLITGYNGAEGAKYQISYIPYGLREYDVLSGSGKPINPNDCEIPTNADSWKDRFISSDSKKVNDVISQNTNERILKPEEVRWYVSGYVTSAAESFVLKYKNQDAWCRMTGTSAEIYKINTVTLGSGTYKIASPDYSDFLGSVQCCPKSTRGDEVCNNNFKWEKIFKAECGAFKSCGSPDWVPYSENEIIKYKCVSGKCEKETKKVECASDYDCKDTNQVCDLNKYKCVDANVNIKGQKIETVADNIADCQRQGGKWITKSNEATTGTFCLFGFGFCHKGLVVTEYCDTSKPNYLLYIGLALLLVVIIAFGKPLIMAVRGALKSTPIGRLIP